jgi:hypothetical protein
MLHENKLLSASRISCDRITIDSQHIVPVLPTFTKRSLFKRIVKIKGKGKGHFTTGHEGPEGE